MASIPFSASVLDALKNRVRHIYAERKSSHLTEAIAAALGFNTHAALLVELEKQTAEPLYFLLSEEMFDSRMQALGYPADSEFTFEDAKIPGMISTLCSHAYKIEYSTRRKQAWRNLIICAVNEALRRRLFSLMPEDNRWPGYDPDHRESYLFDFSLPGDLSARVAIHDAGFDEVSVSVAVNPKGDWVRASNAGFSAREAYATTWVERRNGAWIQSCDDAFRCRRHLLDALANIKVAPFGYGDRGRIMM